MTLPTMTRAGTGIILTPPRSFASRIHLAVEVAYQSRAWYSEQRSDTRLQHAVACALVLAELQMEAEAIMAALLVGVCEDTGAFAGCGMWGGNVGWDAGCENMGDFARMPWP